MSSPSELDEDPAVLDPCMKPRHTDVLVCRRPPRSHVDLPVMKGTRDGVSVERARPERPGHVRARVVDRKELSADREHREPSPGCLDGAARTVLEVCHANCSHKLPVVCLLHLPLVQRTQPPVDAYTPRN